MEWIYNDVDELERHAYKFISFQSGSKTKVVLDTYEYQMRETKRHHFRAVLRYERLNKRDSNIQIADVPKEDWIRLTAIGQVISTIEGIWE